MATPTIYDANQPITAVNPAPRIAIVSLSTIGVTPGVTYSTALYTQPGVSALAGLTPSTITPANPSSVLPSVIVRAG